jgi:polyisoprenoid-binding protein YceI
MLTIRSPILQVVICWIVLSQAAGARLTQSGESKVTFIATGPGGIKIEGQTAQLEFKEKAEEWEIVVALDTLTTGLSLRDRHMKEKYLETPKYPKAELVVRKSELRPPSGGSSSEGKAPAILKLHGRQKEVSIGYRVRRASNGYVVNGTIRLDMRDYDVATPSYLGVSVKPDVEVAASFEVKERSFEVQE